MTERVCTESYGCEYLSHIYLSLSFFGGIMIGYVIDIISHLLGYKHNEYKNTSVSEAEIEAEDMEMENKIINIKMDDINENDPNNKELIKLSLKAAFAIAIHNFPEGIATFVAALANPTLGVSIAVAVAIHNIP
eukprot:323342_1